jgi:hypothetical protein
MSLMAAKVKTQALSSATAAGGIEMRGKFNASIQGTFVGTVVIQRSYDNGSTWETVSKDASGSDASFTAPCSIVVEESEAGVQYRWNCTAYTSGTINTRISQ